MDVTHTGYANVESAPPVPASNVQTGSHAGDMVESELVENGGLAAGYYSAGPVGLINRPYGFYRTEDFTSARDEKFSGNALERAQPGENDPNPMPRVWDAEAASWQPIASLGEDAPSGQQQAAPYNVNGEVESMTTSYSQTEVANSTRSLSPFAK